MTKPTLLLADSNEDYRWQLALSLEPHFQVLECRTGKQALQLLRLHKPDLLAMEFLLPELDGLTLLEMAADEGIRPKTLAFLSLSSYYEQAKAQHLGICYVMLRGCAMEAVVRRLLDISTMAAPTPDPALWVRTELARFPVRDTYAGYPGLETAIVRFERNPAQSFTKVLYVETARALGLSSDSIERNARTALDDAWLNGDPAVWQEYFPGALQRPTVSDFIRRIAQALHEVLE